MRDWRSKGKCRDQDPDLFFPISAKGPGAAQYAQAKKVCRGCPVSRQCLEYALDNGLDHGVYGGMDEDERRALSKKRARASR